MKVFSGSDTRACSPLPFSGPSHTVRGSLLSFLSLYAGFFNVLIMRLMLSHLKTGLRPPSSRISLF